MNYLPSLLFAFVSKDHLAVEFDPPFYALTQPDLRAMSVEELSSHYADHGRSEGRIASPAAHREGFVAQIPTDGTLLEIGPAVRPVIRGSHVRYFEIADKAGLIARAASEGYPVHDCPEIDYVSPTGDLSTVHDTFDGVFSSHCIEHQPNLVRHLTDVGRILRRGGRYYLIVPDKRYCFDALLPESTIEEVVAADRENRLLHTDAKVIEHHTQTTHNDALRHWRGDSEDPRISDLATRMDAAQRLIAMSRTHGSYIDVHAWQFTPDSFRNIVDYLWQCNMSPLKIERVYDTMLGSHEFCAVLRHDEEVHGV